MPDFSYRVFRREPDTLLAIADASLVGKKLEEGGMEIFVSPDFYHERSCAAGEAKSLVESATIVNAVGKGIVGFLIKEKLVDRKNVLVVAGVPHAQIVAVQ